MRLNRGTLILLLGSIVIIAAVLIISSGQVTAPGSDTETDATAAPTGAGPLFAGLTPVDLTGFEVRDNLADNFVQLSYATPEGGTTGTWTINAATNAAERETDQQRAQASVTTFTALTAVDSFEAENLADFGLDTPAYTITGLTEDGTEYTLLVGSESPTAPRYYVRRGDDEANTVYLVQQTQINTLTALIDTPPYVPPPTPTASPTTTPNPVSEVDQTATAAAVSAEETAIFATLEAQEQATATPEVETPEPTSES